VANNRVEERLFRVDQNMFDRAERLRTLFERDCGFVIDTARIDAGGYDIASVVFLEPRNAKRRVEAAREGEDDGGLVLVHWVLHVRFELRARSG